MNILNKIKEKVNILRPHVEEKGTEYYNFLRDQRRRFTTKRG